MTNAPNDDQSSKGWSQSPKSLHKPKPYCLHCEYKYYFLNAFPEFKKLNTGMIVFSFMDTKRTAVLEIWMISQAWTA